jgi:hypothetical protein
MDIFFNELSVTIAVDDNQACEWLENLAKLGKLLKQIIDPLSEDAFSFRRNEDFAEQKITSSQTIREFLQSTFEFSDPVYIFLLAIFDSPYIAANDPLKTTYDLTSITINNQDHEVTGIAAAYLKSSLTVSFDSNPQWDTCRLNVLVNRLNGQAEIITEQKQVNHASKNQHIIDCHLPFLAQLYDWSSYSPKFDPETKKQTILPLVELCSFYLGEAIETVWDDFYQKISQLDTNERIREIKNIAEKISRIHGWKKATGSLENKNIGRVIYTIENSDFIVSVDTQHGEFEVHKNRKGNNHLGVISFDGKRFKESIGDRFLSL